MLERAAARLGIRRLRPEQRDVVQAVLAGRDALVVLPTGFGKSACYQLPALLAARPVVVVSPLLALLEDQARQLERRGISSIRLDSSVRGTARRRALERLRGGGSLLVLTTPETLATAEVGDELRRVGVALAAVDEAHCASEWGHDFRPAYHRLGVVLAGLGAPPTLALTATATRAVRDDIVRLLALRQPLEVVRSPHRDNLALSVLHCGGKERLRALTRLALRLRRPGIVYSATTRDVDAIHAALSALGVAVHKYHGKLGASERQREQEQFMRAGKRALMIATSAFGLGIDKPDIRFVVHYHAPAALERYVQEAGRAGRDGRRAECVLLFDAADRAIHESLQEGSRIAPGELRQAARALAAWHAEGRVATLGALAASAGLPKRSAHAIVAVLERTGTVRLSPSGLVEVLVGGAAVLGQARELAVRYQRLRERDAERLDAMAEYARTAGCRAQFIRGYFDVPLGRPCGICDVCRGRTERPASFFAPLEPTAARRRALKRRVSRGRSR